jgi:Acetyltransferase (GNAT) domain
MTLKIYQIDPTKDERWGGFVKHHPLASVFHTACWLNALQRTYGYEPVAFTTSPPGDDLKNVMVFCLINSWLTGRRLVSLPFSDHCEPLCDSSEDENFLIRSLQTASDEQEWKYLEVRPIDGKFGEAGSGVGFRPSAAYFLHTLSLCSDLNEVFRKLDKDSVQRRIQRADRAGLVVKCGRSDALLKEFYTLFVTTRGRHGVPPMPYTWFQNLIHCLGEALEIRLAYKDRTPVAGILTLQYRDVLYYKYGGSDARFHNLGATPWLLWKAIEAGKSKGVNRFDMGRTEEDNVGLLAFKNHWVPQPTKLVYWKFPYTSSLYSVDSWKLKMAKHIFAHMPDRFLSLTGTLLYRHIG